MKLSSNRSVPSRPMESVTYLRTYLPYRTVPYRTYHRLFPPPTTTKECMHDCLKTIDGCVPYTHHITSHTLPDTPSRPPPLDTALSKNVWASPFPRRWCRPTDRHFVPFRFFFFFFLLIIRFFSVGEERLRLVLLFRRRGRGRGRCRGGGGSSGGARRTVTATPSSTPHYNPPRSSRSSSRSRSGTVSSLVNNKKQAKPRGKRPTNQTDRLTFHP